jgi:hypothetical protein
VGLPTAIPPYPAAFQSLYNPYFNPQSQFMMTPANMYTAPGIVPSQAQLGMSNIFNSILSSVNVSIY